MEYFVCIFVSQGVAKGYSKTFSDVNMGNHALTRL